MIVNAQGILGLFLAGLEFLAGIVLLAAAVKGLRAARLPSGSAFAWESLRHLMLLLVLLLATLSTVSLLVWMLLLQSYVPQWADVRCVVGVLRIGTGSEGATGWLPALADATSGLRAGLLFAAGVGVVLHLVGRNQPEGRLHRRHLAALAAIGLLAMAGAATESAYIVIPKTMRLKPTGCCSTTAGVSPARTLVAPDEAKMKAAVYGGVSIAYIALLAIGLRRGSGRPVPATLLRLCGASAVFGTGLHFVGEVVAPARMGLPLHRCTYCLVAEAPETILGMALLTALPLLAGWRASARWLGRGEGLENLESALDRASLFCLGAGLLFFAGEWMVS